MVSWSNSFTRTGNTATDPNPCIFTRWRYAICAFNGHRINLLCSIWQRECELHRLAIVTSHIGIWADGRAAGTLSPFTVPFTPMALNSPETTVGVVSEPLPLQAIRNNDIASVTAPKQMRLICWQVHKVWLIFIISISLIFEIKRVI